MTDYPLSLRELAIMLSEAIERQLAAHSLRLGQLEEKDSDRKKLLKRFLEVTDDFEANKVRAKKIDEFLEATKDFENKAFYQCNEEMVPDDQVSLPGQVVIKGPKESDNVFVGRGRLVEGDDFDDKDLEISKTVDVKYTDPCCFRCSRKCAGCSCLKSCPLQSKNHGDYVSGLFGFMSVCDSCHSHDRCYS